MSLLDSVKRFFGVARHTNPEPPPPPVYQTIDRNAVSVVDQLIEMRRLRDEAQAQETEL